MSGSTTELNLSTAVDADDNADYLTINLANSLRTLDGLFNNVTGHTHVGAHQGGPVAPAAGSITSGMIADGTIATADLANNAVTNVKLGADTARDNLFTNGGFEIWQRGNGPFTAANAYTADRWQIGLNGTDTLSVSRDTTNKDTGSIACLVATYTKGTGTTTSVFQVLRNVDYSQLEGRPVSMSVRVRTNVPNAVRIGVAAAYSSYHPGDNTYRTLTATLGAWPVTEGYAVIEFAASCTAYIDNAMLVVGSVAADYAPMHPADDLARCLRYYETMGAGGGSDIMVSGIATAAGQAAYAPYPYRAVKPVAPTVTLGTGAGSNATAPGVNTQTTHACRILTTSVAAGPFYWQFTSAGIFVESNP